MARCWLSKVLASSVDQKSLAKDQVWQEYTASILRLCLQARLRYAMEVNVEEIRGNWNVGYSLDKHTLSSTPTGYNEYGHMQFHTIRPPAGEALFQLKYRDDYSQVPIIARQLVSSL